MRWKYLEYISSIRKANNNWTRMSIIGMNKEYSNQVGWNRMNKLKQNVMPIQYASWKLRLLNIEIASYLDVPATCSFFPCIWAILRLVLTVFHILQTKMFFLEGFKCLAQKLESHWMIHYGCKNNNFSTESRKFEVELWKDHGTATDGKRRLLPSCGG